MQTIQHSYLRENRQWIKDFVTDLADICYEWYDLIEVQDGLQDLVQEYWGVGNEGSSRTRLKYFKTLAELKQSSPNCKTFRDFYGQLSPQNKDLIKADQTWRSYHGIASVRSVNNRLGGEEVMMVS